MRSGRLALLALLLVVAACGGSTGATTSTGSTAATTTTAAATTTTTAPGFTVTSEDGDLTVEVPFEAMAEDPGITIRILAPEEYPPELAAAAENPGAVLYSLEPDGLTFDAPVRVTRRLSLENFPGLPAGAIPIVTLLTTQADGSGFELLGDLEVLHDGEDVLVSGDLTHFSPVITVGEQLFMKSIFDKYHNGFETEVGLDIGLSAAFYRTDGSAFGAPAMVVGAGFTRHDDAVGFAEGAGSLSIACKMTGEYRPRVGFQIEFRIEGAGVDEATLRSSPQLIPDLGTVSILVKQIAPLFCFGAETSLQGVQVDLQAAADHPGGIEWIPNEAFLGGFSGAYVWFGNVPRLQGSWAGLIQDLNSNGQVDGDDMMLPVYPVVEMQQMYGYIAPLYGMDDYFVYVIDGKQFDWSPGEDYGAATVEATLPVLESLYLGMGRFDAAIALVTVDGLPFVFKVGPSEEAQTAAATLEIFTILLRSAF